MDPSADNMSQEKDFQLNHVGFGYTNLEISGLEAGKTESRLALCCCKAEIYNVISLISTNNQFAY